MLTLVKASITGSIIGNTLLVLGSAALLGGLRHGEQSFDPRSASIKSGMMILAVSGLYLPAVFATTGPEPLVIEELSLVVTGVLLILYLAYLAHAMLEHSSGSPTSPDAPSHGRAPQASWSFGRSMATLAVATASATVGSELLVDSVKAVTRELGWSEFFVGVVVVAIVGNAAEHFSAIQSCVARAATRPEITVGRNRPARPHARAPRPDPSVRLHER